MKLGETKWASPKAMVSGPLHSRGLRATAPRIQRWVGSCLCHHPNLRHTSNARGTQLFPLKTPPVEVHLGDPTGSGGGLNLRNRHIHGAGDGTGRFMAEPRSLEYRIMLSLIQKLVYNAYIRKHIQYIYISTHTYLHYTVYDMHTGTFFVFFGFSMVIQPTCSGPRSFAFRAESWSHSSTSASKF